VQDDIQADGRSETIQTPFSGTVKSPFSPLISMPGPVTRARVSACLHTGMGVPPDADHQRGGGAANRPGADDGDCLLAGLHPRSSLSCAVGRSGSAARPQREIKVAFQSPAM
jgi:hypothetical protein